MAPHLSNTFPVRVNGESAINSTTVPVFRQSLTHDPKINSCTDNVVTAPQITPSTVESVEEDCARFPGSEAAFRILEIGCGVGNTIFPLLQTNNDPNLFVYGADFSATAVDIIKQHQEYDTRRYLEAILNVSSSGAPVLLN